MAKQFFRQFYLLFEEGRLYDAFDAIHSAAWCCDDADEKDNAHKCRLLALEVIPSLLRPAEPEEDEDAQAEREALLLIQVDMLRRTGQFEAALRCLSDAQFQTERTYASIAKYQEALALCGDRSCHSVEEALKYVPLPVTYYRYYSVLIEARGRRSFYYLAPDGEEYAVGDRVVVPFGEHYLKGEVVQSKEYAEEDVPLPLSKMKTICGPYHVEIDHSAPDYQPQASVHCDAVLGIFTLRDLKKEIHKSDDPGYEWLEPGEYCIFVPNPYGDEPLRIHCGDDFTFCYREWKRKYEYPRVENPSTPLDYARNEIARRSLNQLYEHLLGFVERRLSVVMVYIADDFVGGALVNSTTVRHALPVVLLNKVTNDPSVIQRARQEGARLEIRSWQSMLDHTKVMEPRGTITDSQQEKQGQ